jgi:hypothetical protein
MLSPKQRAYNCTHRFNQKLAFGPISDSEQFHHTGLRPTNNKFRIKHLGSLTASIWTTNDCTDDRALDFFWGGGSNRRSTISHTLSVNKWTTKLTTIKQWRQIHFCTYVEMRDVFYPVLMSVTEGYDECITLGITRFTDFANRLAFRETQYFGK